MFDEVFFLLAILPELEVIGLPDYDGLTSAQTKALMKLKDTGL